MSEPKLNVAIDEARQTIRDVARLHGVDAANVVMFAAAAELIDASCPKDRAVAAFQEAWEALIAAGMRTQR